MARTASAAWLAVALALYLVMLLASAWRWDLLLKAQHINLPFRRLSARLGAAYVATEMVASELLAAGRPDVIRRAAVDEALPLTVIQLVGREARWMAMRPSPVASAPSTAPPRRSSSSPGSPAGSSGRSRA